MTTFSLTGFESDGRKYFCKSVVFGNPHHEQIYCLMEFNQFIDLYIDKILFNVPGQKGEDTIS
jgi:hypothetical protein